MPAQTRSRRPLRHRSAGSIPTANVSPANGTASDQDVCHAISLNLGLLTKAAASPDDPSLDQTIAQLRQLRDVVPAEISGDLQVIADFDLKVLTALRSGRSPDNIQETPQLTAALSHQARWAAQHCTALH